MIPRRPGHARLPLLGFLVASATVAFGCDRIALLAPTEAVITLVASSLTLPANGFAEIIATVIEQAGTPVHNGTLVTFSTTRGRLDPQEARTKDGIVKTRLFADGQSGLARVTAFSGSARAEVVEIRIGGAAVAKVELRASPAVVSATRGGSVQLIASVTDTDGAGLPGVPVTFTASAGTLTNAVAVTSEGRTARTAVTTLTDQDGNARTTLTTNRDTTVTATAGNQTDEAQIEATTGPVVAVDVVTSAPTEDQITEFTISVTAGDAPIEEVTIDFGDGTRNSLGNFTGSVTVSHVYRSDGARIVTVTAVDRAGERTVVSIPVTIAEAPPLSVTLTASTNTPAVGTPVVFTATVTPSSALIEEYSWNFGDGTRDRTSGNVTSHVYRSEGIKTVEVTAKATDGRTGKAVLQIVVAAFSVTITASSNTPTVGDVVTFTATVSPSTAPSIEEYTWSWGDGTQTVTSGNSTTHVYRTAGTKRVEVTAKAVDGSRARGSLQIVVQAK